MLNYMWAFMILIGVLYAAVTGNMSTVTNAALDSAGEAVSLCLTMAGVMALWMGLMEIAQQSGLIERMTKGIGSFLTFMFPKIPKNHPARGYIATNIISNVLGLGWACTPAGLKAMEALADLEAERGNVAYLPGETGDYGQESAKEEKQDKGRNTAETDRNSGFAGTRSANRLTGKKRNRTAGENNQAAGENGAAPGDRVRVASNEMCTFLILNISSLQLIPVNMIAYD